MFWGLVMEPGRVYTQKVKRSFHVSMAAMDILSSNNEPSQIMCVTNGMSYLLCTLNKNTFQCPLDLHFGEGTKLSFATSGKAVVHLSGYLVDEEDFTNTAVLGDAEEDVEEDEDIEEEEEVSKSKKRSKRELAAGPPKKKSKTDVNNAVTSSLEEVEEEESSDSDFDIRAVEEESSDEDDEVSTEEGSEEEGAEEEEDDEEEDGEGGDEDLSSLSDEEEEVVSETKELMSKVNGISKKDVSTPKNKLNKKESEKTPKSIENQKNQDQQKPKSKKTTLKGGVIVEELKEGSGDVAKPGKFVHVFYEGRLKENNKMFDSTTKGPGFRFRLGKGEVIKGWDLGVAGMKVGGKRRIICPPATAYGPKGSPPVIPPNSTLVFEVELKKIS